MRNILDLSAVEIEEYLKRIGEPRFRKSQIWNWLYVRGVLDFQKMSNLPKKFRERLSSHFKIELPEICAVKTAKDGTIKLGLTLQDKNIIETVLIPERTHYTQCVSSQVGCSLGCKFCSTGRMGFVRNLTQGEILGQILLARAFLKEIKAKLKIRNLVFMGMGEPLLNWDNVKNSLYILRDKEGFDFSYRHTTISTVGIPKPLREFAEQDLGSIALSLHAPTQSLREEIMPRAAKIIPLNDLIALLKDLPLRNRQRITIEYILIGSVNDSLEHAKELNKILSHLKCKINLIPFNPGPDIDYIPPDEEKVKAFEDYLRSKGQIVTLRKSKGQDISAACGQLRAEMGN